MFFPKSYGLLQVCFITEKLESFSYLDREVHIGIGPRGYYIAVSYAIILGAAGGAFALQYSGFLQNIHARTDSGDQRFFIKKAAKQPF